MAGGDKGVNLTWKAPKWCTFEEMHIQIKTVLTTKMYEAHPISIKIASSALTRQAF